LVVTPSISHTACLVRASAVLRSSAVTISLADERTRPERLRPSTVSSLRRLPFVIGVVPTPTAPARVGSRPGADPGPGRTGRSCLSGQRRRGDVVAPDRPIALTGRPARSHRAGRQVGEIDTGVLVSQLVGGLRQQPSRQPRPGSDRGGFRVRRRRVAGAPARDVRECCEGRAGPCRRLFASAGRARGSVWRTCELHWVATPVVACGPATPPHLWHRSVFGLHVAIPHVIRVNGGRSAPRWGSAPRTRCGSVPHRLPPKRQHLG
jgi:hypothetical protein